MKYYHNNLGNTQGLVNNELFTEKELVYKWAEKAETVKKLPLVEISIHDTYFCFGARFSTKTGGYYNN